MEGADAAPKVEDRRSALGLASRHALDAARVDKRGRKALHRFAASCDAAPEHLKRVVDAHPEACGEADGDGMYPLHHYCKSLSGQYEDDDDDFERHLGMLDTPSKPRAQHPPENNKRRDRPGDPVFFRDATSLEDVRKEYRAALLRYHPDKNLNGDVEENCRQMQRLQDAYQRTLRKFHKKQPIEEALACGDVEKVLASLAEPDAVDGEGSTILHRVCGSCAKRCSPAQLAAVVCAYPEALTRQNDLGDTPLHELCGRFRGDASDLDALVGVLLGGWRSFGGVGDVDDVVLLKNNEGRTPLHALCRCQRKVHRNVLARLVNAWPEAAALTDAEGYAPLHIFCQYQLELDHRSLKLLLRAAPRAASLRTLQDGDSPLHLACYAQRRTIADDADRALGLLAAFAPVAALSACAKGRRCWSHLPSDDENYAICVAAIVEHAVKGLGDVKLDVDDELRHRDRVERAITQCVDGRGGTLLHVCASCGAVDMKTLAKVFEICAASETDKDGRTPLHRFCACPARESDDIDGRMYLFERLLKHPLTQDARGATPLHVACAIADDDAAAIPKIEKLLAVAPESASLTTKDGRTAAHECCASCASEIGETVPAILEQLAAAAPRAACAIDGRKKRAWDYLPRHDALFERCFHALLGALVEEPEKIAASNTSETILHLVCAHHAPAITRVLNDRDVRVQDAAGNTPLHCYCEHQGLTDVSDVPEELEALLGAYEGALGIANKAGHTPLHVLARAQKPAPALAIMERFLRCECVLVGVPHLLLASRAKIAPRACELLRRLVAASVDPAGLFARENGKRPWDFLDAGDVRFAEVCAICLRAVLTASSGPLDAQDRTPLHLLCSRHGRLLRLDAEYVEPFLGSEEAALAEDASGGTPLHAACRDVPCDGDMDVSFLTRVAGLGGASIQNASGWTPLHIFAQKHALVLGVRDEDAPAWRALRVLIDAHPAAAGIANAAGDTCLHLVCAAHKRGASQNLARLLDVLLEAAGPAAERAATARGKGDRSPLEWLPRKGEFYAACEEVLVKRRARCLALLLDHCPAAASASLPESGDLALHQLCGSGVASVPMLETLLKRHPEAATTRNAQGKTPLDLLCCACVVDGAIVANAAALIKVLLEAAPGAAVSDKFDCFPTADRRFGEIKALFDAPSLPEPPRRLSPNEPNRGDRVVEPPAAPKRRMTLSPGNDDELDFRADKAASS